MHAAKNGGNVTGCLPLRLRKNNPHAPATAWAPRSWWTRQDIVRHPDGIWYCLDTGEPSASKLIQRCNIALLPAARWNRRASTPPNDASHPYISVHRLRHTTVVWYDPYKAEDRILWRSGWRRLCPLSTLSLSSPRRPLHLPAARTQANGICLTMLAARYRR